MGQGKFAEHKYFNNLIGEFDMQRTFEKIKEGFKWFRDVTEADGDELYKSICNIIMNSEELMRLADNVPMGQPYPNIILGGIHYLLLQGADDPLKEYFATIQGKNVRQVDEELPTNLFSFFEKYRSEMLEICKTKRVQTNDVGRCAFILPALAYLKNLIEMPLILLEIGTSAGLLLNYDQYGIEYSDGKIGGRTNSKLKLRCEIRGSITPPRGELPQITKRIGIDLFPVDITKPNEALWLEALVWENNVSRFNTLRTAIEIAKQTNGNVELIQADGFRSILDILQKYLLPDHTLCIYHSFAINQISKEDKETYYESLKKYSDDNSLLIYEVTVTSDMNKVPKLLLNTIEKGDISTTTLAKMHYHGQWIEWLVE